MNRKLFTLFCFVFICINVFGQTDSLNNTITINGTEYYYRPSSIPSSPQPAIEKSGFINEGSWYGEEAAKAWAFILNWAIENCQEADDPITIKKGEKVYIHQVHAYRNKTLNGIKYIFGDLSPISYLNRCSAAIKVFYWVVPENGSMENGRREYRRFWFY